MTNIAMYPAGCGCLWKNNGDDMTNKYRDLLKVERVFDSCTNDCQREVAYRMFKNWRRMYKVESFIKLRATGQLLPNLEYFRYLNPLAEQPGDE